VTFYIHLSSYVNFKSRAPPIETSKLILKEQFVVFKPFNNYLKIIKEIWNNGTDTGGGLKTGNLVVVALCGNKCKENCNFTVNRDHLNKSKETRVVAYMHLQIRFLVGI